MLVSITLTPATNALLDTVKNIKNSNGNLDLIRLQEHNLIEHDASLVHPDASAGNASIPSSEMIEQFMATSSDGL